MDTAEKTTRDEHSTAPARASGTTIRSSPSKGARPKSYVVKLPASRSRELESYSTSPHKKKPTDKLETVATDQETFTEVLTPDLYQRLESSGHVDEHLRPVNPGTMFKMSKFPIYSLYLQKRLNTVVYVGMEEKLTEVRVYNILEGCMDSWVLGWIEGNRWMYWWVGGRKEPRMDGWIS